MGPLSEAGPRPETEGTANIAGGDNTSIAPGTDFATEVGGLLRIVRSRDVDGWCVECWRTFDNTGAAASHARSTRHQVDVKYSAEFVFIAAELMGGVR